MPRIVISIGRIVVNATDMVLALKEIIKRGRQTIRERIVCKVISDCVKFYDGNKQGLLQKKKKNQKQGESNFRQNDKGGLLLKGYI